MASVFANLPVPTADGPGVGVSVDELDYSKTLILSGDIDADIAVQVSPDDTNYCDLETFVRNGDKETRAAAMFMRALVTNYKSGSAVCRVGAISAGLGGAAPALLNVPAGDGAGSPADVQLLGARSTVGVSGPFTGTINIEMGLNAGPPPADLWSQAFASFNQPGCISAFLPAMWLRVVRSNVVPGSPTPVVWVCSNIDPAIGSGGGGGD